MGCTLIAQFLILTSWGPAARCPQAFIADMEGKGQHAAMETIKWEEQTTSSEPEKMHPGINTGGSRKSRPCPSLPSLLLHRLSFNLEPIRPYALPNKLPGLPAATLGIISHSCSSVSCTRVQSFQPCPGLEDPAVRAPLFPASAASCPRQVSLGNSVQPFLPQGICT